MNKVVGVVGTALLVLTLRAPAQGVELRIGANANYGTSNSFGVGPRLELAIGEYIPGLRFVGDYHRFFDTSVYSDLEGLSVESDAWNVGFHILYDFTTVAVAEGATLYAGLGVLHAERQYDQAIRPTEGAIISQEDLENLDKLKEKYKSDLGTSYALSVGSVFNTGWTVLPFVEARYTIGIVDEVVLAAGILFSTGAGAK